MLLLKSRPQYGSIDTSNTSDHFMAEYKGVAKCYSFNTICNRNIYQDIRKYDTHIYNRG